MAPSWASFVRKPALISTLLLSSALNLCNAAPSIEVDLQAAFLAPPFLLELMYVRVYISHRTTISNGNIEKPQQPRMPPASSLSLTQSRLAASRINIP